MIRIGHKMRKGSFFITVTEGKRGRGRRKFQMLEKIKFGNRRVKLKRIAENQGKPWYTCSFMMISFAVIWKQQIKLSDWKSSIIYISDEVQNNTIESYKDRFMQKKNHSYFFYIQFASKIPSHIFFINHPIHSECDTPSRPSPNILDDTSRSSSGNFCVFYRRSSISVINKSTKQDRRQLNKNSLLRNTDTHDTSLHWLKITSPANKKHMLMKTYRLCCCQIVYMYTNSTRDRFNRHKNGNL